VKAGDLKALLEAQGFTPDNGMATHLLAAAESAHIPLSYALALVEKESRFQNIYGHDAVRNPIKSPPGGVRRVTLISYRAYKAYRRRGFGCQGVGPAQLTYFTLQDEADRMGGCHKPQPNMCVGFRLLKYHINQLGKQAGAAAYNGTGPAADVYGRDWVRRQAAWHEFVR
jgi:hypothetical protein